MENIIFSNQIKELRVKADLKQEVLASMVGVSKNMIIKYEKQQAQPSLETILKLMYALNATFNEVVHVTSIGKRRDILEPGTVLEITENVDAVYEAVLDKHREEVYELFRQNNTLAKFTLAPHDETDQDAVNKAICEALRKDDRDVEELLIEYEKRGAFELLNACGPTSVRNEVENQGINKGLAISLDEDDMKNIMEYGVDSYIGYLTIMNWIGQELVLMWRMSDDENKGFKISYATADKIVIEPNWVFGLSFNGTDEERLAKCIEANKCRLAFKEWVKRGNVGKVMRKVFRDTNI